MKTPRRRQFLYLATGVAAVPAASRIVWAQTYPRRPVRWIVGFAPGGMGDIIARPMGQWLSGRLGQPFIIENRPGAAGNIATEAVVRAPADATRSCWSTAATRPAQLSMRSSISIFSATSLQSQALSARPLSLR